MPICSGFVTDLHLHTADPSHPIFHVTAHPTLTSLVFLFTADPSSTANPSFIVNPSSIGIAFIKLKRTVRLIKVEMRQRNLALVVWLDFVGFSGFCGGGLAGFGWVNGGVAVLVVICVVGFG